ncbi:MAG: hypothetical protein HY275_04470 [Gemmatimonadetes bacterium]|nr:hypothetical protein [Gemmatimonadota bacterium]
MLRVVLMSQWRTARWFVVLLSVLAFAVPILTTAKLGGLDLRDQPVRDVLTTFGLGGLFLAPIALLLGVIVGIGGWSVDATLGHVYMLVHPVPRWYLVLLRFAAGVLITLVPAAALLVANTIVTVAGTPPDLVRAYPVALTIRFAALSLVMFGFLFGAGALPSKAYDEEETARRALIGIGVGLGVLMLGVWLDFAFLSGAIVNGVTRFLAGPWSPITLVVGRWGLYDI